MTDRHAGFIVTLEKDIREEDSQRIIELLAQIRGVVSILPVVSGPELHIAESRAKHHFKQKVFNLFIDD